MVCLTGFHVTDKSNVGSIMANGFTYNKNTIHWLVNWLYFFDQNGGRKKAINLTTEK